MRQILSEKIPFIGGGAETGNRAEGLSSPFVRYFRAASPAGSSRVLGPERRLSWWQDEDRTSADVRAPDERSLARRLHDGFLFGFNFVVAVLGLLLLAPFMLLIAIAIKLDSPGPVIFRQLRVGRDRRSEESRGSDGADGQRAENLGGRPFFIYKFRTMEVDAEKETGPVWARSDDDRCTRVGRVLRRYRLDELPQLWNVVRGEMSIVGPRPERPGYVKMLRRRIDEYPDRQKVRPGITGWAQIHQDSDSSVEDVRRKVHYDIEYLRERSLKKDLEIMLRTPVVMIGRGDRHEAGDGTDGGGESAG
jgi:lipopolysaccharide/colanic/teichoic acid biosynthesis glycosyltransferase